METSMANQLSAVRERLISARCQYIGHVLDLLDGNPQDEDERSQLMRQYDFATAALDTLVKLETYLPVAG